MSDLFLRASKNLAKIVLGIKFSYARKNIRNTLKIKVPNK
jgi:hypothetical protein